MKTSIERKTVFWTNYFYFYAQIFQRDFISIPILYHVYNEIRLTILTIIFACIVKLRYQHQKVYYER